MDVDYFYPIFADIESKINLLHDIPRELIFQSVRSMGNGSLRVKPETPVEMLITRVYGIEKTRDSTYPEDIVNRAVTEVFLRARLYTPPRLFSSWTHQ